MPLSYSQAYRQPGTGLTAQGRADGPVGLAEPIGGARVGGRETGQALGEDTARARRLGASEAADDDVPPDAAAEAGQVGEPAHVLAVDSP